MVKKVLKKKLLSAIEHKSINGNEIALSHILLPNLKWVVHLKNQWLAFESLAICIYRCPNQQRIYDPRDASFFIQSTKNHKLKQMKINQYVVKNCFAMVTHSKHTILSFELNVTTDTRV